MAMSKAGRLVRFAILATLIYTAAHSVGQLRAEMITGLTTDGRLIRFDSLSPDTPVGSVAVSGLGSGQTLVAIDVRPIDLALVGVARNTSGMGQVYTLDRVTGAATALGGMFNLPGTALGMDFNPVPNALRLVTDAVQADNNFRITAGGGGTFNIDGRLNVGGFQDPALQIVSAAYTNNVPGGVGGQTTLYVIEAASGFLFMQGSINFPPGTSPNTGSLFSVGSLGLGTGLPGTIGFDISGSTGTAYLSLLGGPGEGFYRVNLANGAVTSLGALSGGVRDIAVDPVPEPGTWALMLFGMGALAARRYWRKAA